MTQMPAKTFGAAALLALISGCGGGATSAEDTSEQKITACLPQSEFVLNLAPIIISELPIGSGGYGSGFTMTNLGGYSTSPDSSITITAYSSQQNAQTELLERKVVAKDGISIGLDEEGMGEIDIYPPETENCVPIDVITIVASGIPGHETGSFPNSENPYAITEQTRELSAQVSGDLYMIPVDLTPDRLDGFLFNGVPIQMRELSCAGPQCGVSGTANPLHAPSLYGIDSHNAHVLSDGSYHYHGDPHTLYDDSGATASQVIGFGADGVPIFGPWINDGGLIRKATSSYHLKTGYRPEPNDSLSYDGTFAEDYEYVDGSGDLDVCNGMFIDGVYGYVVTDTFPYVMNCLRREPDPSFNLE